MRREEERRLNLAWMRYMAETNDVLREKMVLFWHNHFACRTNRPEYALQLNTIHREHALGSFREMLFAVSRSPAMLAFLNNQQNRKGHPNENFAREVMELFTLGQGNYTEQDVKEAARAFTGWSFDQNGDFQLRKREHDDGQKIFLGEKGIFGGEDILDRLLARRQCAVYICRKLYRSFVNEVPDEKNIGEMASVFFDSGYDIARVMRHMFTADWFYRPENRGNLIKSPVEMLVGLNRQFRIHYQNPAILLRFQRVLGQQLFNPPNVAGWPGGRNWIDSSTLLYRMQMPSLLLNNGEMNVAAKTDPEDEALIAQGQRVNDRRARNVLAGADWNDVIGMIPKGMDNQDLIPCFLQRDPPEATRREIQAQSDRRLALLQMVSTPEYQLC